MKRGLRVKTEASIYKSVPFQNSIETVMIERCEKVMNQLQKGNVKLAQKLISGLDKDLLLLHSSHSEYHRLQSLAYNTKAAYHRKIGNNEEALKLFNQAILIENNGHVDAIDMARTLLNKSVVIGQMAREQSNQNQHSHEEAISLAKQALQLLKNRPENKLLVQKDQYKLGELIIISFHNIATELICLKNQQGAYNLYKKAYDLAIRIMGPRHSLTTHLKQIIGKNKENKKKKTNGRRILTELEESREKSKEGQTRISGNSMKKFIIHKGKNQNDNNDKKKYRSFMKAYGYSHQLPKAHGRSTEPTEMRQLSKLQKIYKPTQTGTSYLPSLHKKNIKEIIKEQRVGKGALNRTDIQRKGMFSATETVQPTYHKNQIVSQTQEKAALNIPPKVEEQKELKIANQASLEQEKGCQLI